MISRHLRTLVLAAVVLAGVVCSHKSEAREVALKTNLLYDAAATPNLGLEFALAPKWSLDISGQLCAWTVKNHYWKHWIAQPEARYWLCDSFQGHFFGLHAIGGQFNIGNLGHIPDFLGNHFSELSNKRFQGWGAGAGIAYGYSWILGKHWNLEAEIGIGWIYTKYDVYPCAKCGTKESVNQVHNYVGPTKAALNIVYVF